MMIIISFVRWPSLCFNTSYRRRDRKEIGESQHNGLTMVRCDANMMTLTLYQTGTGTCMPKVEDKTEK